MSASHVAGNTVHWNLVWNKNRSSGDNHTKHFFKEGPLRGTRFESSGYINADSLLKSIA